MKQLHAHGVSSLLEVSVIGFDDIAIAPYTIPALSSVKIPVTEMIQETIGRLIFMLGDGAFTPSKTSPVNSLRATQLRRPFRADGCHLSSSLVTMTRPSCVLQNKVPLITVN